MGLLVTRCGELRELVQAVLLATLETPLWRWPRTPIVSLTA